MREAPGRSGSSGVFSLIYPFFVGGCPAVLGLAVVTSAAEAQMGTFGAWATFIESNTDPVAEIYLGAPPAHEFQWTIVTKLAVTLFFKK